MASHSNYVGDAQDASQANVDNVSDHPRNTYKRPNMTKRYAEYKNFEAQTSKQINKMALSLSNLSDTLNSIHFDRLNEFISKNQNH